MGKCYLVGGAVRDEMLGRKTNDFDYVVVGCTFEELSASYGDPVGKDFPVFIDPADGSQYAMARRERKTGVGYHGFACEFGTDVTLEEDLSRRDLTINALAKDCETAEIIDYFGGLTDLRDKVLRHVSPAFAEDPLRVVRLARFAARYDDFSIDVSTRLLCTQVVNSGEMDAIPFDRYWLEISKAVDDGNVGKFFRVLALFGCFEKVKFFKDVWDTYDVPFALAKLAKVSTGLIEIDEGKREAYLVALTAKLDMSPKIKALNASTIHLHQAVGKAIQMEEVDVETIFQLFKMAKVWQEGSIIEDVVDALNVYQKAGYHLSFSPTQLRTTARATLHVTSQYFQHLEGKAIGEAMMQERKAIIAHLMGVMDV